MEREKEKNKPLREMTTDEIAQIPSDRFKALSDAHNDELELRENSRSRRIRYEQEDQNEAWKELIAEAEKMPREVFEQLPAINDWDTRKTLVEHGIPNPDDPPHPLMFRDASGTPLEGLANKAWGNTLPEAIAVAAREDDRKIRQPVEAEGRGKEFHQTMADQIPSTDARSVDDRFEEAQQRAANRRPSNRFLMGPADLAPPEQLRQGYAEDLKQKSELTCQSTKRESLPDRIKREAREQGKDVSQTPQPDQKRDPLDDLIRR